MEGLRYIVLLVLLLLPAQALGEPVVRALRVERGAIKVDGRLDEREWMEADVATGFIQREPRNGERATERTEVRVLYDDENLYIGAILYDSRPDLIIAYEKKRDADLRRDDAFAVLIDTYHDHRNGFFFETNPLGARADALVFDEGGSINFDWDGVWWVEAMITPMGWQVEMKIPFRTLRFDRNRLEPWGLQMRRIIKRKNEEVYWAPLPLEARIWRVSKAGELTGLKGIGRGWNLGIKPYLLVGLERIDSEGEGPRGVKDTGVDLKYGITPNITLDLTVNTDFAQTEADISQVNITRFPLFFPEKRDFFLEGSGYFDFGLHAKVQPFFSRRIGLVSGREIPILFGGKVTGKAGPYSLGLLSVETKRAYGEPETNYTVVRLKRDIGKRSDGGVILVNKEPSGGGYNRTAGGDVSLVFRDRLYLSSFLLKSFTQGEGGDGGAGYLSLTWSDPERYVRVSYLDVEEDFNPEVGFVRRKDIREGRIYGEVFFRPEGSRVRKYSFYGLLTYMRDHGDRMIGRTRKVGSTFLFHSGDYFEVALLEDLDRLDSDFEIRSGITIPKGSYTFRSFTATVSTEESRRVSGELSFTVGQYYDGDRRSFTGSFDIKPLRDIRIGPKITREEVDLPGGSFKATYLSAKVEYAISTLSALNLLIQWNDESDEVSANIRFAREYRPGSNLYLVYNGRKGDDFLDHSILFKVTYLFNI